MATEFGKLLMGVMRSTKAGTPKEQLIAVMKIYEYHEKLIDQVAKLESENDRLQSAWYYYETICPDGSLRPKVSDLLQELDETKVKVADRDKALDDMVHELSRMEIDRDELLKEMQWRIENKNNRIAYLKRRLELAEKEREK